VNSIKTTLLEEKDHKGKWLLARQDIGLVSICARGAGGSGFNEQTDYFPPLGRGGLIEQAYGEPGSLG